MIPSRALLALAALCLAACQAGPSRLETVPIATRPAGPPDAEPGTCWGRETTPAVIETVTEQVMLQPPEIGTDGAIRSPAVYKTETHQRILRERRDLWFQTLCPSEMDEAFIAALQRALAARGLHRGPVTGRMDLATRTAILRYQAPQGLDSTTMSLAAARKLGLVAYDRGVE